MRVTPLKVISVTLPTTSPTRSGRLLEGALTVTRTKVAENDVWRSRFARWQRLLSSFFTKLSYFCRSCRRHLVPSKAPVLFVLVLVVIVCRKFGRTSSCCSGRGQLVGGAQWQEHVPPSSTLHFLLALELCTVLHRQCESTSECDEHRLYHVCFG